MVVVIWVGFMAQWLWHPDTCPYGPYLWVRYLQLGIDGHLIESRGRNALPCYVIWSQKWLTGASKIINQAIGSPHFLWLRNNKVWRLPTWLLTCHWISLYLDNKARHDKRIKFMILFVTCNIFVITRKGFVLLTFLEVRRVKDIHAWATLAMKSVVGSVISGLCGIVVCSDCRLADTFKKRCNTKLKTLEIRCFENRTDLWYQILEEFTRKMKNFEKMFKYRNEF